MDVKYETISNDLKAMIENGHIKPGDKVPSVSEICKKYRVSHVTALRGLKTLVSQNYTDFVKGKGYYVRITNDHNDEKKLIRRIACILRPYRPTTADDNYYNEINMGVQRECFQRGYDIVYPKSVMPLEELLPSDQALNILMENIIKLKEDVDGFIIDNRVSDNVLSSVVEQITKPVIIVNRNSNLDLDVVVPDNKDGAAHAAGLCLKLGYENFILCRNQVLQTGMTNQRNEAFRNKLLCSGISEQLIHEVDYNIKTYEDTFLEIGEFFSDNLKTLIFSPTDSLARWVADKIYLNEYGLGTNIGVLSFDGTAICQMKKPHLTNVNVHPEEIGRRAVEVLISRINGHNVDNIKCHVVPSTFIIGETI